MKECSDQQCCCPCHSSESSCHTENHEEISGHYFLEIADCAWEEVLKDEIKNYILATQKDRMKGLAKLVAETNNARWKNKMEKKQGCADFEEQLHAFFSRSKK